MKRPATAAVDESSHVASVGNREGYEDICPLAAGGYGLVTKARHRDTGRTVAIKFLVPDDDDEDTGADMLMEARFLAACDGVPFVVGFHELVRYPDCPNLYLVMEYVGPSIADLLRKQGGEGSLLPLQESTVRAVMRQLLTAAAGMHARGVVHCDIKPDNILVAEDHSVVKICDFGLAMSTSDRSPYELAGTPGYRAPEVLLELPEYDGRVDTWSLGCVMAEFLTGRPLFESIQGSEDQDLLTILRVLGVPDEEAWPGFLDTPFATERWKELMNLQQQPSPNVLRERIPETVLSNQGFEVMSGLLVCNPDDRLTAAAALKLPWFAEMGDALQLPIKKTLPLPEETKEQLEGSCAGQEAEAVQCL
jgi:serine/threonine protein kinase